MSHKGNKLTVQELHDVLEQMIEEEKGDYTVSILHQPNWPFVLSIGSVKVSEEDSDEGGEVFLCEGKQLRYGPKFEEAGEDYWG